MRRVPFFIHILFIIFLCNCVPDEVILHGDISGYVTDAASSEPIAEAKVSLSPSNDSTLTENDGSYFLKNITPADYEILASKASFNNSTQHAEVISANSIEVNFELSKAPYPEFSETNLDFSLETTVTYFTISNIGAGTLRYYFSTSQDWIAVDPENGEATTEKDTIKVTIDRTGLSEIKQEELITVLSYTGETTTRTDDIDVLVNGVLDQDDNYYGIVTIGSQVWLAENLKTGRMISPWNPDNRASDDGDYEKYCYDNLEENCNIYGGLYSWAEMMDYSPPDNGTIGTTQGICPAGWHLPTFEEWVTLFDYLGGNSAAGGSMKDTGTIEDGTGYWKSPNEGATNESGFTALPGGGVSWVYNENDEPVVDGLKWKGEQANFWTTGGSPESNEHGTFYIQYHASGITSSSDTESINCVNSVRCIKDP